MSIGGKVTLALLLGVVFGLLCRPVQATDCTGMTDSCRTVVPSIDMLRTGDYSGAQYAYITVTCYHDPSPANAICAGGGDFDMLPSSDLRCQESPDNGATVIRDSHTSGGLPAPDCFYRKNFGLNGVVDARQCGVYGDGLDHAPLSDGDLLNKCMVVASQAGVGAVMQNTLHIVTTGGGVVLSNNTDILIPANTLLTCSGNSTAAVLNDDYRHVSNALVLNPTSDGHGHGPYTVKLANSTSTYVGCNEIAGPGPQNEDGSYPNPYSPMLWYPDCKPQYAPICSHENVGTAYLRSAISEYSAFNPNETALYNIADGTCVDPGGAGKPKHCGPASASVGIHLTASEYLTVRNVTVLGFGTCIAGTAKGRLVLDGLHGDCWLGLNVASREMPVIRDCSNGGLLAANPFRTIYR